MKTRLPPLCLLIATCLASPFGVAETVYAPADYQPAISYPAGSAAETKTAAATAIAKPASPAAKPTVASAATETAARQTPATGDRQQANPASANGWYLVLLGLGGVLWWRLTGRQPAATDAAEPTRTTGVEKYLQTLAADKRQTGVEKYVQRHNRPAPTTGVEKYLARKTSQD